MSEDMELLTTSKGKPMLLYEGFTFSVERANPTKMIWKCSKWSTRQDKCFGRLHTNDSGVTWHSKNHNHLPDPEHVEYLKNAHAVRERAKTMGKNGSSVQPLTLDMLFPKLGSEKKGLSEGEENSDNGSESDENCITDIDSIKLEKEWKVLPDTEFSDSQSDSSSLHMDQKKVKGGRFFLGEYTLLKNF